MQHEREAAPTFSVSGFPPLFLYLISLWFVGVKHLQCLVEIVDDGLVLGIGSFNDDAHVVVGVLVADAAEEHGELVSVVVLLKPTLEKQAALSLAPVAGVADVEHDGGIDTEELNEDCHHGLLDLRITFSPHVAHVVDIELIGVAVANSRVFLELYLVEHVVVGLKQVDAVCDLLNGVGAVGLDA